jgi:hypothetical protein
MRVSAFLLVAVSPTINVVQVTIVRKRLGIAMAQALAAQLQ